jgi:ABC-2 type transport system ATP-binding protein
MTAIITRDLKKFYGSVHALDGLSLTVQPGTVFGFLGPNGAGKTTTIRLLTGLSRPTSGAATVSGVDARQSRKIARIIGYLPEEPAFYRWMTGFEFIDYTARIFHIPTVERTKRVKELLELVGLADAAKRRIGGYSRGMRQRLGIAQSLVNQPEVLFLDEPVSALDPTGRKEVLDLIASLRGKCTVFMSTHILADVERVCDSIGIIDKGKMIVEAPQSELMRRFTIPAIEVEVIAGHEKDLENWLKSLRNLSWVKNIQVEGTKARLTVKDLEKARKELFHALNTTGLPVQRFEVVTPTLEDIFLQVITGKGGAE